MEHRQRKLLRRLNMDNNLEHLLSMVKQISLQDAFRPAMEALVADGLLRYPDIDVKVSVASCISEIMRITAPDQPYDNGRLKDFFELAVLAFEKLSCLDGRCYSKAVSIIVVLAKYRACVLMWELKLGSLIIQMFQHFLNSIRPDHPDQVFMNIKEIMSIIIEENDELPMQLLNILISSVQKENQNVSPRSYELGEKVLQENAVKLHAYLPEAVRSLGISTNNYSEVVELICGEAIQSKAMAINVDDDVPVLTPGTESKKIVSSNAELYRGEASDNACTLRVEVHGYRVLASNAPIFAAIFAKYGDIAANCHNEFPAVRAFYLDVACDVVRELKSGSVHRSSIKAAKSFVSLAEKVNVDMTWLQPYMDRIPEDEEMEETDRAKYFDQLLPTLSS